MDLLNNLPQIYSLLLPLMAVGFVLSLLLTPIVGKLTAKYGLIDLPSHLRKSGDSTKDRRIHKKPTPLSGGIAVIVPFVVVSILVLGLDRAMVGLMFGVVIMLVAGVIDDKYNLPGKVQFIIQWIAALVVVVSGSSIDSATVPFDGIFSLTWLHLPLLDPYGLNLPADLITAFWIVLVTNAMNWVNGSDGLAEGVSAIASLAMMFIAVELGEPEVAILAAVFTGSMLGFLPFNFYPAKIFSGGGAPAYGFIIATLAILGSSKFATALIVLAIPLADMIWVLGNRVIKHKTINIFKLFSISDKTHLHHRLYDLGLNVKQVAYVEYIFVGIFATIALFTASLEKIGVLAITGTIMLVAFLIINTWVKNGRKFTKIKEEEIVVRKPQGKKSPEDRFAY